MLVVSDRMRDATDDFNAVCLRCRMLRMLNIQDVEWIVQDAERLACEMLGIWDIGDAGYLVY